MDSPRKKILDEAAKCVLQNRNAAYGGPEKSFELIARLWSEVLGAKVTPHQVALCMVQLKVARLIANPTHHDSKVDGAGYFACMAEFDPDPADALIKPVPADAGPNTVTQLPPTYTGQENGGKNLFQPEPVKLPEGALTIAKWLKEHEGCGGPVTVRYPNAAYELLQPENMSWRRIGSPIKQLDYLITSPERYIAEDFADGSTVAIDGWTWVFHRKPTPHFVRA